MDEIEKQVARVMAAIKERRETFPRLFSLAAWGDPTESKRAVDAVFAVAPWGIGRDDLTAFVRERYKGAEQNVDFNAIAELIPELARQDLRENLVNDQGFTAVEAEQIVARFHLSAPLQEPD